MGTSGVSLGDVRPDNTSAIIALQRSSNAPLELVRRNLYQSVEDLGRIYLDMMRVYYGKRLVRQKLSDESRPLGVKLPETEVDLVFDFAQLEEMPMSLKLEVGASSYWSEIAAVQTLDNLLAKNKISLDDYLERVPEGYISRKQELIEKIRGGQGGAV